MRLMLHTLKKDARHLWPAAAATWLMLAALANADRWRADWISSPLEGWINLLLSAAWACLAALAVLEEPLMGDRHFWMTQPHRWPPLLAAKLVFVVLAIHLPSLLADVFVLAARGFRPAVHLDDLLWKQILFFGCVILPAIAVAALVRNFTHFVIALFTIGAGIAILNGGFQRVPEFSHQASELRHAVVRILLAGTGVAVVCIQYARRWTMAAPLTGIAGALAAAAVSAYLPARMEYAVRGAGAGQTPRVAQRNPASDESIPRFAGGRRQYRVLLPIAIAPGASGTRFHVPLIEIEISAPDGTRIHSVQPTPNRPFEKIDLMAYAYSVSIDDPPQWLVLMFSGSAWDQVKNARVRIRGSAAFEFYDWGETTILPLQGSGRASGLGRCAAVTVDDRYSEQMLKVLCESPRALPAASITLRHPPSGRVWRQRLNSAFTYSPGPHETWLSPLHRGQSFFHLTNPAAPDAGSQWLVPASHLSTARVEITPEVVTEHALTHFDFSDITLSSWLVRR